MRIIRLWETPKEDYMASLQSLEAGQTELSPETFTAMIRDIETLLSDLNVLKVPVPTEAWTARVKE